MRGRNDKNEAIKAITDSLDVKVKLGKEKEQTSDQFPAPLPAATTDRNALEGQLTEVRMQLQQHSNDFGSSGSRRTGNEPHPKRRERWIQLNEIFERNARMSKTKDSTAYSHVTWDQVKHVFNQTYYEQPRLSIDNEKIDFLERYLSLTTRCLGDISDWEHATRLHVIAPILICVRNLFDGDVDIVVKENLVGNVVKAHGHFEFMLRCGNKVVCITHVKQDYLAEGIAQGLIGCEVAAELGGLDIVYGIVTNYVEWSFLRSLNDKVEMERCVLDQTHNGPMRESLKKIAEKIYSMLSS